ncbi:unnamed protein product [Schistosoma curassoni]|uniref:Innexin n=1 Tax=Schistosoma curassoni TaxID=6186 RepID=A0A183JMK4_9TREM|nr:unnamed protein product [Schistosoma curassoni]
MFFSCKYTVLVLPICAFTSASDPPCSSMMLPKYVNIFTSSRPSPSSVIVAYCIVLENPALPLVYTLQCVLPVNYFIEKVYIFLWFWYILMACLTILNTFIWITKLCLPYRRVQFIRQYLKALKQLSHTEETECARFVNNNLGWDGIFLLQAVSKISSDLIVLDVTGMLWSNYQRAKITGTEENIGRFIESINRV